MRFLNRMGIPREIIKESSKTLVAAASLLCLCVACKPNTHLLAGKSYGVVDAANAISANDLMQQSAFEAEQKFVGKIVTFKDLQATEVGTIDTSKNACEYEFDGTLAPKGKYGIQLMASFNLTPEETKTDLRDRITSEDALGEIIPDTTLFSNINTIRITEPLCKGSRIFGCSTHEQADHKICPFENGKYYLSGKVLSIHRTHQARMVIYILPTGYSSR